MSVSQATDWAERSSKEWGSIFNLALAQRTKFSETPDALPFHARVPEFDRYVDGQVVDNILRASGFCEWEIRSSIAGLVPAKATTFSTCILAIQSPMRVNFDNNYPRYPEGTSHLPEDPCDSYNSMPGLSHPASIVDNTSNEPNYLGLFTLAWGYVLSEYWAATQKGEVRYTEHKAPCNSCSIPDGFPRGHILHLDASTLVPSELRWWQAVVAPNRGWDATIYRQGQTWQSPWTVENHSEPKFAISWNGDSHIDVDEPPGYQQAHDMLVEFTNRRGLQYQASIALMAALNIPTHNLWSLPVRLPLPQAMNVHCSASTEDTATFKRLKDQLPRLVTVALFGVESFLRSGFYEESIHSLSSGQWIQPAIVSWPDSTAFAAEVGCRRTPHLAKWWIGMAVTGMLSKRSLKLLLGDGLWPTNLGVYAWTGAKDSHFCTVFGQDIGIPVRGTGKWATIPRAQEALALFATSGEGPQGRLMDPPVCPWRPPCDVLLERTRAKVIEIAHINATIRLYYNNWQWGLESREVNLPSSISPSASFDQMAESSGSATRSLLGWLENMRGSDADFIPEFEALKDQIRRVEADDDFRGSANLSDVASIPLPASDCHPVSLHGNVEWQLVEAELGASCNGDIDESCVDGSFGWCGLEAVNSGLSQLNLPTISKDEAVRILSVTWSDVERNGMSVNQLEALLNTRDRSVAIVNVRSKQAHRLAMAKYKDSVVVGLDSIPHFMGLSQ